MQFAERDPRRAEAATVRARRQYGISSTSYEHRSLHRDRQVARFCGGGASVIRPGPLSSVRQSSQPFVTRRDGAILLNVGEQLVSRGRQELRDAVLAELEKGENRFVIDFSRTGYIDSAGLGVLISISKQIREHGGDLMLTNLNEDLRSLFQLTKLDTLFGIIEPGTDTAGRPVAPIKRQGGGDGAGSRG